MIARTLDTGSLIAGRYEVISLVGTGGMGTVYKVIDRSLDNTIIALKFIHPHLVQDSVLFGRFRNEVLV